MKLETKTSTNYSRGIQETNNYLVADNPKIFSMLSDMLYSDKVLAPIRELCTNAWDAHVEAGTTHLVPTITLPTLDNLVYSLRDRGTGLSELGIVNLYRIYGASSKDDSNDYNGAMGIGSKSPFCYVDSFTVTSYYNGKQYIYINNKYGADGKPEIKRLNVCDTNEPNGLQISFVVKKEDVDKFRTKTAQVISRFPKQFEVIDDSCKFKYIELDAEFSGKGWKFYSTSQYRSYYTSDKAHAVMGYIAYPIDDNQLTLSYEKQSLLRCKIDIDFDIGDIEMDISRENLQYTQKTIKALEDRVDVVYDEFSKIISTDIINAPTLWDARIKYNDIPYQFKHIVSNISYKGTDLKDLIDVPKDITCSRFENRHRNPKYNISYINASRMTQICVNDVKGAYIETCRNYLKELIDNNQKSSLHIIKAEDPADIDKFLNLVGVDKSEVTYISTLQQYKPTTKRGSYKRKIRKYINRQWRGRVTSFWQEEQIDLSKTSGYYVEFNNYNFMISGKRCNPYNLKKILETLDIQQDVYGITKLDIKKLDKNKWTNVIDILKSNIKKYQSEIDLHTLYSTISSSKLYKDLANRANDLKDKELATIFTKALSSKPNDNYSNLCTLANYGLIDVNINKIHPLAKQLETKMSQYPLLSYVYYYGNDNKLLNHIVNYINCFSTKGNVNV